MSFRATATTMLLLLGFVSADVADGPVNIVCFSDENCGGDAGDTVTINFPSGGGLCANTAGRKSCNAAWGGDNFYNSVYINVYPNNGDGCPALNTAQCQNFPLNVGEAPTCFNLKHPDGDYADITYMTVLEEGDCCLNC